MSSNLMINNMYAAYTATLPKSDQNVSTLSKILKTDAKISDKESDADKSTNNMDTVIISKQAFDKLKETYNS